MPAQANTRPAGRRAYTGKVDYSHEFPSTGKTARYLLGKIPTPLWRAARAKAAKERRSMRNVLLTLLNEWLER